MSGIEVAERTAERLQGYGVFNQAVIDQVADNAGSQAAFHSYETYLAAAGALLPDHGKHARVLDVVPDDFDPMEAMVVDLPFGNALDPNQQFAVATLADLHPDTRVIAFPSPATWWSYRGSRVAPYHVLPQAIGDYSGSVREKERYLERIGVETVVEVGPSYGATLMAAAAANGRYPISHAIAIEPVEPDTVPHIVKSFASCVEGLDMHVGDNQLPTYEAARNDSVSMISGSLGYLRPVNLTALMGLSTEQGSFMHNMARGRSHNANMDITMAWGSNSEMISSDYARRVAQQLGARTLELRGARHALMNDMALWGAIVLQAERTSTDS